MLVLFCVLHVFATFIGFLTDFLIFSGNFTLTQMVARLTKDIVETYQVCNPSFKYFEALNPKRYLTSPHTGVSNDGHDNEKSDLILSVNLVLVAPYQRCGTVPFFPSTRCFPHVENVFSEKRQLHVAYEIIT